LKQETFDSNSLINTLAKEYGMPIHLFRLLPFDECLNIYDHVTHEARQQAQMLRQQKLKEK
jgi:hypothetical protein